FPLKSYGFSGAETARKRFLLWKMGFSSAKIAPSPPYTPPGTIEARKGFGPLALSSGVFYSLRGPGFFEPGPLLPLHFSWRLRIGQKVLPLNPKYVILFIYIPS